MAITVKEFCYQSYRLINASNPTVSLHGDDEQLMILVLNQLLNSYASTGLMVTIAKTVNISLTAGQGDIIVGPSTYVPTPDITAGRLANYESAWLELSGVDYPLIPLTRDEFQASWKYRPLQGLPRFCISYPDVDVVKLVIYPAPSQFFEFFLRGKFQLNEVASDDSLDSLPGYYIRFLLYAVAKDTAFFKGRSGAWDEKLEDQYKQAKDQMEAASEVNLSIVGDRASLLNGAWRVRAGI